MTSNVIDLSAYLARMPADEPVPIGGVLAGQLDHFVVVLRSEDHQGLGECLMPATAQMDDISDGLKHGIDVMKPGLDSFPEMIELLRSSAIASWMKPAIDVALFDLKARVDGVTVARLLSDAPRDRVQLNAVVWAEDRGELRRRASFARRQGFNHLKIKVGGRPIAEDVLRVTAAADAFGSPVRIDANASWSLNDAIGALEQIEHLLEFAEQPVEGIEDLARLRSVTPVRIAADEAISNAEDVVLAAAAGAADLVAVKISMGGLSGAIEAARAATSAGIGVYVRSGFEKEIGVAAALHLACAVPKLDAACGLTAVRGPALALPHIDVRGGQANLNRAPGLATDLLPAAIRKWAEPVWPCDWLSQSIN